MKRFLGALCVCVGMLLTVGAIPAGADGVGPTLSGATPASASNVATTSPTVAFEAVDADRVVASKTKLAIDGIPVAVTQQYPRVFVPIYVDDEECGGYFATDFTRLSVQGARRTLADGLHTAHVELTDAHGNVRIIEWTFTVAEKPTISSVTPVAGARTLDRTCLVTSIVRDSGSIDVGSTSVRWRVANTGSSAGGWTALPVTFDAASGALSATFAAPLTETRYEITITAADTAGNLATMTTDLFVGTSQETMQASSACSSCHASHPIDDCSQCHDRYRYDMYPCEDCHEVPDHDAVLFSGIILPRYHTSARIGRTCTACHGQGHVTDIEEQRHASSSPTSCAECHARSLPTEHAARLDAGGSAMTCQSCHASSDPIVRAAIASGNTACEACHANADHEALHVSVTTPACFGSGCHDVSRSLTAVHALYVGPGSEYGYDTTCELCHENRDSQRIDWRTASTACTGSCHSGSTHSRYSVSHTATAQSAECTDCHGAALASIHGAGADLTKCARCHSVVSNWSKDAECRSCHSPHGDVTAAHAASVTTGAVNAFNLHVEGDYEPATVYVDCRRCHDPDLVATHSGACLTCHAPGAPATALGEWNGTCQQGACHVTYHQGSDAIHESIASCDCHDANWATPIQGCRSCHAFRDYEAPVTESNARAHYGESARITLSPKDPDYGSGLAHTYFRLDGEAQQEGTFLLVDGPSSGIATHTLEWWSVDGVGNEEPHHQVTFDIAPDDVAPTTSSDIQESYEGGALIELDPVDPSPSSNVEHTYYRVDGGATKEGTTLGVFTGGTHTIEYWSVDGAGNEENPHNVEVFSVELDSEPPVTTLELGIYPSSYVPPDEEGIAYYIGQPFIEIASTDSGGSGSAHTYYQLNGSPPQEYIRFQLYVQGPYAIRYWSEDNAGNVEAYKELAFVVDFTSPVVTTDAQPTYAGTATITMTASDPHSGVERCYWRIGPSGPVVEGPTITLDTPGTYRLYPVAVNRAGIANDQQYVDVTITP